MDGQLSGGVLLLGDFSIVPHLANASFEERQHGSLSIYAERSKYRAVPSSWPQMAVNFGRTGKKQPAELKPSLLLHRLWRG